MMGKRSHETGPSNAPRACHGGGGAGHRGFRSHGLTFVYFCLGGDDDMSSRGHGAFPCIATMQGGLRLELVGENYRDFRPHEKLCLGEGGLHASLNFTRLEFAPLPLRSG